MEVLIWLSSIYSIVTKILIRVLIKWKIQNIQLRPKTFEIISSNYHQESTMKEMDEGLMIKFIS